MILLVLVGCAFVPESGGWIVANEGITSGGGCTVIPALPGRWELAEADDGFTFDPISPTACTLDDTTFSCEPVTYDWEYRTESVTSTLRETLTLSGEFLDVNIAEGDARVGLSCTDDDCPNDGDCEAELFFRLTHDPDTWFDL